MITLDESRVADLHIKVSDLATHPGRLLCLHVSDGGEGGPAGGVQGQAGHNLPDILLLLDASPGSLKSMHSSLQYCQKLSGHVGSGIG